MSDYFGKEVFKLGFGMMRLPKKDGEIDIETTKKMVDLFIEAGGTYFDTAYVYDGGKSEEATCEALVKRYPRDKFTICTKLNAGAAADEKSAKQQFEISLKRLGCGYFDYYLLHALSQGNIPKYDSYGIWDYVKEKKAQGLVKYFGFSFHDSPETLEKLLTEHPEVDFIQLQINYADWESDNVASRACYEIARKHGKSITVMEPVKGGALANPIPEVQTILKEADPNASFASWAIRYVASLDGILTVLSGMSNIEQMEDNLSYMRNFKPLTESEQATIRRAQFALMQVDNIKCTGCHYCTDGCPMRIPIPEIFTARNEEIVFKNTAKSRAMYEECTKGVGKASDCIKCMQCEGACPQHLAITDYLEDIAAVMD